MDEKLYGVIYELKKKTVRLVAETAIDNDLSQTGLLAAFSIAFYENMRTQFLEKFKIDIERERKVIQRKGKRKRKGRA